MVMRTIAAIFIVFLVQSVYAQIEKLSSDNQPREANEFVDARDGQTYPFKQIGNLVWMTTNLNYKPGGAGWCYDNHQDNCRKYGMLYTWQEAQKVCPRGWHLPDKTEFESLLNYVYYDDDEFFSLIKGGESGFAVIYAGWRAIGGGFGALGSGTNFWTTTESGTASAWVLGFSSNNSNVELVNTAAKVCGFSVRCVKD